MNKGLDINDIVNHWLHFGCFKACMFSQEIRFLKFRFQRHYSISLSKETETHLLFLHVVRLN